MAETLDNTFDVTKLYDLTKQLADLYRNELININAVASGKLVNFTTGIDWDGEKLNVYFNLPHYWGAIEWGRRPTEKASEPHLFDAILNWVKLKGITARDGKDQTSLAWAITKKIHKQGFFGADHHGKKPLATALERARGEGLLKEIVTCVADGYGNQIQVALNTLTDLSK